MPGVVNWEARVHAYAGRKEWVLVPNMVWNMVFGVGGGELAYYFLSSSIIA